MTTRTKSTIPTVAKPALADELEAIFARVRAGDEELQEDALWQLRRLIADFEKPYELGPEEIADIEAAEAAEARGEFASEEEVARVFRLGK
ncbi:MAG: hypothetical protein JSR60_13670 [Proteobacteria bacterium]|nr:hypothetical protein [Pseudomonadota bacterium]